MQQERVAGNEGGSPADQPEMVVSADSHVVEPSDLWVQSLGPRHRDRAPRVFWDPARVGWFFGCDGIPSALITTLYTAGQSPEEFAEGRWAGPETARPGASDARARLGDMDQDGVSAEVLYPSLAISLFWLADGEFQRELFRIYNDWLADFVKCAPERLIGVALISLWDVDAAVREMERCRSLGLSSVAIWASAPEDRPLSGPENDRFWAAAQDLGMPVGLHILTGFRDSPKVFDYADALGRIARNMAFPNEIQATLTELLFSGLLERFPELKIVLAENDIGWIGYHLLHADRLYEKMGTVTPTSLTMKPSEYFRRQIYATFMDDPVGVLTMRLLGSKNFMWGSDYPHYESTWPRSRKVLAQAFEGVPADDEANVVHRNCMALYGLTDAVAG